MAAKGKRKDYEKIAAEQITTPSQSALREKFLFYSRPKKGKTRLGLTAPHLLVLDAEHGTDRFRSMNPAVWHLTKWEDVNDAWRYLRLGKHPYRWVQLDTMTKINNMALNYVRRLEEQRDLDRRPGIIDRRDYNKSGELMKQMILNFVSLPGNIGVIFVAQERVESSGGDDDEDDGAELIVPDLPKGVRGMLNSQVDLIGRLYVVHTDKNGKTVKERRLQIGTHERYDTGYRSDDGLVLPDVVRNPTMPKLVTMMRQGGK